MLQLKRILILSLVTQCKSSFRMNQGSFQGGVIAWLVDSDLSLEVSSGYSMEENLSAISVEENVAINTSNGCKSIDSSMMLTFINSSKEGTKIALSEQSLVIDSSNGLKAVGSPEICIYKLARKAPTVISGERLCSLLGPGTIVKQDTSSPNHTLDDELDVELPSQLIMQDSNSSLLSQAIAQVSYLLSSYNQVQESIVSGNQAENLISSQQSNQNTESCMSSYSVKKK
ncbi:hypothetical protein BD770DRAFT_414757 [Pilaira anomala]|nr:hypothetical protein BD770DRAFT_414757 [Pilaira anomala]